MATKLLLLEDIDGVGRSGDLVNVRPGFARNFLLPQGFAMIASKQALRKQKLLQEERQKKAIEDKKDAEVMAAKLAEIQATVSITVKVDHEGHMYGSVSALDIVNLVRDQLGIEMEKKFVQIKHPIKEVGQHTITLKLKEGIPSQLIVKIEADTVQG
jgi:large subunit ribosomal protein L9